MSDARRVAQKETRMKGIPLSEGCAVARVCLLNEVQHVEIPVYHVREESAIRREIDRVDKALLKAGEDLEKIREEVEASIGHAEAEIFVAHMMILKDPTLHDGITKHIREEHMNAEAACARTMDAFEARLLALKSGILRERASDFADLKRRLLSLLGNIEPSLRCAGEEYCQKGHNRIIVTRELTPSLAVGIDVEHIVAFVTEHGGVNSHAAILARARGIPAVSGLPGIMDVASCGTELLVNGTTGEVVVWPNEATVTSARYVHGESMRMPKVVDPVPGFKVLANINGLADVQAARQMGAEGVGLYRTEFEVIAEGRFFSEDELYERYAAVVDAMRGRPVIFRMLDVGSDKTLPFMGITKEENPSLGWRGTRFLLGRKDLLRAQARALARVSQLGEIHVMYPMIVDADQFVAIRQAFLDAVVDIPRVSVRHGPMFEVPSACLMARKLMALADFASIGTNDLTQYLFAVDRENDQVSYDYNPDRDVFWDVIRGIAQAAAEEKKHLSICGELGGDPRFTTKLIQAGIRSVSVSPRRIPGVRLTAQKMFVEGKYVETPTPA